MAAAAKLTRMDQTAAGLRDLAVASRNSSQSRRLLALAKISEGRSREDAAHQAGWIGKPCGIGCCAITSWVRTAWCRARLQARQPS